MYLCYDIRGIQSFIFRIPKLKYIIGGSALIDRFDRSVIKNLSLPDGCVCLFAGGGKGTFDCPSAGAAESLKQTILSEAHKIGVDVRFGIDENYDNASKHATDLYPFIPGDLSGAYPCNVSGLYPVAENGREHEIVRKRLYDKSMLSEGDEYKIFRYFENRLLKDTGLAQELDSANGDALEFFHNVKASDGDGAIGAAVLGDRNRWAVICMDGNDMGSQMTAKIKSLENDPQKGPKMSKWVQAMSSAIDNCSTEAAKAGIRAVYEAWVKSGDQQNSEGSEKFVLPVRPLVVGGDDITMICHVRYAMDFVKAAVDAFERQSIIENEKALKDSNVGESVWPATGGKITISAGVLYCPVSLPLHSAIAYTEALLASAKTGGRKVKAAMVAQGESENLPTPASIDWEHITDSVIETPAIYRQRHLYFEDGDLGKKVSLTKRPYTIADYASVEELKLRYAKVPNNIRHKVVQALAKGQNDRMAFVASIAKSQKDLAIDIAEPGFELFRQASKWSVSADEISTSVVDALQLLEEEKRMEGETNND